MEVLLISIYHLVMPSMSFLIVKSSLLILSLPRLMRQAGINKTKENSFGTCMAYRMAKTALNQGTVTMAREWEKEGRKLTMVNVEPGFISTRLTGWDGVDDMTTCIAGLMRVFKDITPQDNGALIKWDGNRIPY